MKDLIEKKLESFTNTIVVKENPTMEEINFMVYMLNRIETKEKEEQARLYREQSDKEWREKMASMIGGM